MNQPARTPGTPPLGVLSTSFALLITALWGGNAVATSYTLDVMHPLAIAAVRFTLASLFMLVWCRVEGAGILLRPQQISSSFILGILLFIQISLFNYGVKLSNASHGVLLVNTAPFWVLAIEHFITHSDRITRQKLIGLLLATCGVVVIVATTPNRASGSNSPSLYGDSVLILSSIALAVKIVYTRHAARVVEPGKLILWHGIFGVFLFALFSLAVEPLEVKRLTTPAVLAFLYNGLVVGGACYVGQALLLKKHSASQIAVFNFAAPVFGVLLAWLLRGDQLSPWLMLSVLCVAGGIVLVNQRAR